MATIADHTLGISSQALAILSILSNREPSFAEYQDHLHHYKYHCETSAWYNCCERGVCLVVRESTASRECLIITFGECRNSDFVFVDAWEHDGYFLNPPTVTDFSDEAYAKRKSFEYLRVDQVVNYIIDKISEFLTKKAKT